MRAELCIKKEDIPEYLLRLAKSGACPYLMPCSYYSSGGLWMVSYETAGFSSFKSFLSEAGVFSFSGLLSRLRRTAEGLRALDEYLVCPGIIQTGLDTIHFSPAGHVNFFAGPGKKDFSISLLELCDEASSSFPLSNADIIVKRLRQSNAGVTLGLSDIIRILSLWELEIKN